MSTATARPTLILVHGATLNGHMWDAVIPKLDPRFAIVAPDLPEHGSRRREKITLAGAVATVTAAARAVAPSPVVLVGDSLGGYTSLASASALPASQLKGLVLGGCSSNLTGTRLWPYKIQTALFAAMKAVFGVDGVNRRVAKDLRKILSEPDAAAVTAAGVNVFAFANSVAALQHIDFRAKLAAVEQPVLIVNGGKDRGHLGQEASFLAVTRNGSSHRFEGCEHGVSIRRSPEFAQLVNDFARRAFAVS